jgi:RNA polymerase sigma-70 factor (ECF subfamily)
MANPQPPRTRLTLIGALCQGLRWEEFVALYGRLILSWGRRDFGLQDSDAENLCQEVLIRVWKGIAGYDPAKGRFRNWLYTCTRNAVLNLWRDRHREAVGIHDRGLEKRLQAREASATASGRTLPVDCGLDEALQVLEEEGFAWEGLQEAVRGVRAAVQPGTWKAFLLFEFFDLTAKEIGPRLGLTPAAVNQAVYRVRQLLQQALPPRQPARQETPELSP